MMQKYNQQSQNRQQSNQNQIQPFSRSNQQHQVQRRGNDMFEDFSSHQMNVFQEFNDMSNQMMQKMEQQFSMMPKMSDMMKGFGRGFDDDDDDFGGLSNFSNLHKNMAQNMGRGPESNCTMVSKSYVSSTKIGPDGKKYVEKSYDNNVVQKANGQTISDRQQAYKNDYNGVSRVAQERLLNDQGRKFIKERDRNGAINETNHYYNLEQERKNEFDQKWNQLSNEIGFFDKNKKFLSYGDQNLQIRDPEFEKNMRNQQYQQPQQPSRFDEERRGHYVPQTNKLEYQPVQYQQKGPQDFNIRRQNDLQPIMLGGGNNQRPQVQLTNEVRSSVNPNLGGGQQQRAQNQQQQALNKNLAQGVYKQQQTSNIPKAG